MPEYLFIRHGQTDWNLEQRVMGRRPIPLNEKGRKQAEAIAKYLKDIKIDAVATSPVTRALETAQVIVKDRPGLNLVVEEGLSEIEFGDWVNLTFADLVTKHADIWKNYHGDPENMVVPGGEALADVRDRAVNSALNLRKKYPDGRIALVSHADVIKLAVIGLARWPMDLFRSFSMDNGAMILLREHPTLGVRMVWYNCLVGIGKDTKDGQ